LKRGMIRAHRPRLYLVSTLRTSSTLGLTLLLYDGPRTFHFWTKGSSSPLALTLYDLLIYIVDHRDRWIAWMLSFLRPMSHYINTS
jgi:hypothetical protein